MPEFEIVRERVTEADVEVVAVPAFAGDSDGTGDDERPRPTLVPGAEDLEEALGVDLAEELTALRFDASVGATVGLPTRGAIPAATIVVVGVGPVADVDAETVRTAAGALAEVTADRTVLATTLPAALAAATELDVRTATQATVEGLTLASYRFTRHRSENDGHELERALLLAVAGARAASLERGVATGRVHADATCDARDLVNEPPGNKRPPDLAERVRAQLEGSGVEVEVLDEDALADGGFGGMLAVGKGSEAPPRLVRLTYRPRGARRHVALVGKGITFDSGGLSLKTGSSMMWMKADMAGAAAVHATLRGAARLGVDVAVTGILCLAENMPSAGAQRPGDVYTARNGTTVEVLNTDAEGRLVLSDGLALASELEPDAIVDLATLTGAAVVALGREVGAVMGTHDGLVERLLEASELTGERLWRLPLPDRYRSHLDSDVADLKNIGKSGQAGAVVAGLFLREFVDDGIPWAHLDIAGIAWAEEQRAYTRKGGTGAPVRTLLTWLADGAKLQPLR